MDWSSLCKNKDVSVSHLYSLCFFEWCFSEAFLFYILVSSTQGHPSTNSASADQPLTRLLTGLLGKGPPDDTGDERAEWDELEL